jgi:hypothetical protein
VIQNRDNIVWAWAFVESKFLELFSLQAKRLKTLMLAAAELAALRLRDLPANDKRKCDFKNRAFCLLDKNGDGRISVEELTEVMEDLGASNKDATELMHLLDANSDGSLSSEEFESFQRQVVTICTCLTYALRRAFQYFAIKLSLRERKIDILFPVLGLSG